MGGLPQHLEDSFFGGEGLPGFAVTDSRPNQKTCHVKDSRSKPRGLRRRAWQEYCHRQHMRQCGTLDRIVGVHRGAREKFTVQDFRWPCPKKGKKRGYKEWPNSSAITAGHRASLAEMLALENSRHQRGGGVLLRIAVEMHKVQAAPGTRDIRDSRNLGIGEKH